MTAKNQQKKLTRKENKELKKAKQEIESLIQEAHNSRLIIREHVEKINLKDRELQKKEFVKNADLRRCLNERN